MAEIRMYIWRDVLVDYTSGIAVAMAHSVDEARAMILKQAEPWEVDMLGEDIAKEPDEIYEDPTGVHVWGGG